LKGTEGLYNNILVCVTQQKTCSRLIKNAASIKHDESGLYVIHVAKESWNFLNNSREGEALDYLFDISKSVGANLTVLRSDNIPETIAQFAKDHDIELIVMGETLKSDRKNDFLKQLKKLAKGIEIKVIPA